MFYRESLVGQSEVGSTESSFFRVFDTLGFTISLISKRTITMYRRPKRIQKTDDRQYVLCGVCVGVCTFSVKGAQESSPHTFDVDFKIDFEVS